MISSYETSIDRRTQENNTSSCLAVHIESCEKPMLFSTSLAYMNSVLCCLLHMGIQCAAAALFAAAAAAFAFAAASQSKSGPTPTAGPKLHLAVLWVSIASRSFANYIRNKVADFMNHRGAPKTTKINKTSSVPSSDGQKKGTTAVHFTTRRESNIRHLHTQIWTSGVVNFLCHCPVMEHCKEPLCWKHES